MPSCAFWSPTTTASTRRGSTSASESRAQLSDDVWVVAPEHDQSGVAHSLSLNDPLRLRKVAERRFAVKRHADRLRHHGRASRLGGKQPDLVLSGVNRGRNVAEDVIYSGTVAGAMEGTVLGIPSIALSQAYRAAGSQRADLGLRRGSRAAHHQALLAEGIRRDVLINVNFPDCRPEDVKGIAVTMQGRRDSRTVRIERRKDGRGNPYYWIAFERDVTERRPGTDLEALAQRSHIGDAAEARYDRRGFGDALYAAVRSCGIRIFAERARRISVGRGAIRFRLDTIREIVNLHLIRLLSSGAVGTG